MFGGGEMSEWERGAMDRWCLGRAGGEEGTAGPNKLRERVLSARRQRAMQRRITSCLIIDEDLTVRSINIEEMQPRDVILSLENLAQRSKNMTHTCILLVDDRKTCCQFKTWFGGRE